MANYPYEDLEGALGRPLTEQEFGQVWDAAPGTPGGGPNQDWPAPTPTPTPAPSPAPAPSQVNVPGQPGRWKVGGDGKLYWDPNDIGPDQTVPTAPAPVQTPAPTPAAVATPVAPSVAQPAAPAWTAPAPTPVAAATATTPASVQATSPLVLPESLTSSKASTFTPPAYVAPPAYIAPKYTTMTAAELATDPSYNWRFDQGQKALQTSQAAKGITRTGGSMVDLVDYGQHAASQEYGAAEARKQAAWDRNYEGSQAEYAPTLLGWQTKTANDQRNAELQFDRDWQQELYNRDDAYRRMVFMADDNFRKVVYGTDDAFRKAVQAENDVWKRQVMEEERRRWLAELGAAQ